MNNPSEILHIDENLARLLAAYDQGMDGADGQAPTIGVPKLQPLPGERAVTPMTGNAPHEGSLGELLPGGEAPPAPLPPPPHTPAPPSGQPRVGRFELRRQLGKGGCGIVFLAFDPKLEREVALKIPRPEMLLSQDARRRLIREALAAAEFDHPNLVPVYETGEIGPVCFIATAFCPGQTLGEWLDRQAFPVPVRQAARLVATVAEAVQHAHDRGVLHRDLKPNNVILQLTKDDPNETEPPPGSCYLRGDCFVPRVVDFGLAKLLERGGPSETTTRQILGTPKYMAPEQAQARHEDVGPAADVYALGVILYEMLSGRAPFEGATDVEVLRQAIDGELITPRRIRSDIPRDLEAICLKAMDRNPGKRFRTAIDLSDDLRRFLDGKPTIARPLKWPGRAARWLRRNDQAVALVVVTTVATVLLAVGSWSQYQTRQAKSDRDVVLRDQAERTRTDQRREYARNVREAFLAWRAGDTKGATDYLDAAQRIARTGGEPTDFAHAYLTRLVAAERLTIVCPAGAVTALTVSPDGTRIVTGHADGTIAVWDRTGVSVTSVHGHDRGVAHAAFPEPGLLMTADALGHGKSWVVGPGGLVQTPKSLDVPAAPDTPLCIVRHGTALFTAGDDGVVRVWDASDESQVLPALDFPSPVVSLAVHPEGGRFVVATPQPVVVPFSGTAPQIAIATDPRQFSSLRFPTEGPVIGVANADRGAVACETTTRVQEKLSAAPPGRTPVSAELSVDCGRLAVGDGRGRVTVWSVADQTLIGTIETGQPHPVRRLAISEDGRFVAVMISEGLRIFAVGETASISTLAVEDSAAFRFLPGGERIATAGAGNVARVWSVATGREELTLYGHIGRVTGLGVSPDGRILVTGSVTGEVKLWDLRTGWEVLSLRRHSAAVNVLEFSANGKSLVTGGTAAAGRGQIAVWEGVKE